MSASMSVEPIAESDDVPEPIRCYCYGDGFVSIDAELQMSALGPNALATIAKKAARDRTRPRPAT